MPLSASEAEKQARSLYEIRLGELGQLDIIRRYWKGRQALPAVIPTTAPHEVKVMSRSSRVNIMPIVVNSLVQGTFVDGYRADLEASNAEVWSAWQANRMDARQTGLHRATFAYGRAYAIVLPGDPFPVIRPRSPRQMTCVYGEDPDWPMWALERISKGSWRLYDEKSVYYFGSKNDGEFEYTGDSAHGANVGGAPVVRYIDEDDLDADDEVPAAWPGAGRAVDYPTLGQVAPLMPIQDQIDLTTFGLQVAQHYGAFKQRYILGWVPESEAEKIKIDAARVVTLPDAQDDNGGQVKVGEWAQTDLTGFLESREASLRHAATLSQTPVHELIGELVNLSAEALAAAEAGHERKKGERKTNLGESHEQTMGLVGQYMGVAVPDDAQVVWRDTSARAFAATVDGLGKLAQMLGVPAQELWERIPGVTKQDVDRWRAAAGEGDAFADLTKLLDRQSDPANGNGNGRTPLFG